MVARSSWKGILRLSLVSVPVEAFNATTNDEDGIQLHQLHAPCHSRIRYQKMCPIHGEVSNDEIVLGYEREKGKYVVVEKGEVEGLKNKAERAIEIDTFISPDMVDAVQFSGRTYYLLPNGQVGLKPYAVLLRALETNNCYGVGQAQLWGRDRLILIRVADGVMCMEVLHFHTQIRDRAELLGDLHLPAVSKAELGLASKLIEASTSKKFKWEHYEDAFVERLKQLLESKSDEQVPEAKPGEDERPVINLMDALRRSVANTRQAGPAKRPAARSKTRSATPRRSGRRHAS
jgi:DNA end-binding protein Ku